MNVDAPKTPRFQQGEHVGARRLNGLLDDMEHRPVNLSSHPVQKRLIEDICFRVYPGWTDGYQTIADLFITKGTWRRNGITLGWVPGSGNDHPTMPNLIRTYTTTQHAANAVVYIGLQLINTVNAPNPDLVPTGFQIVETTAITDTYYGRNDIRWIAKIEYGSDSGGLFPIVKVTQLDHAGQHADNVVLPNTDNWNTIENHTPSKSLAFRPQSESEGGWEQGELQFYKEHDKAAFPVENNRMMFLDKDASNITVGKWGIFDGSQFSNLSLTGDYNSLQIRASAAGYYFQIYDFESPPTCTMSTDALVPIRQAEGGNVYIRWATLNQFFSTGFTGGGYPISTITGLIKHNLLDNLLSPSDDHHDQMMKYFNLGTPNAYARNTALSGAVMCGGTLQVQSQIISEGTNDVDAITATSLLTAGGANIAKALLVNGTGDYGATIPSIESSGGAKIAKSVSTTTGDFRSPTGHGLIVNGNLVVTDQQPAEADAGAINASTNDADAAKLSDVQSLRTTVNNLLAKLRAHGLIDT